MTLALMTLRSTLRRGLGMQLVLSHVVIYKKFLTKSDVGGRDDQRKLKEEVKRNVQILTKLQEVK